MIRIRKPPAPAVLLVAGASATRQLRDDYEADPAGYQSGARSFPEFDACIYADAPVKSTLVTAQHGKCAFCESRVTHIAYGGVEHFRPKRAVRRAVGRPLIRPGYFWLAYDWDNLLLACQLCNQRHKQNLFPLRVERDRCRSHADPLAREQPVFIHPGQEDPTQFITFVGSSAVPVRRSRRGRRTIDELGLNRSELLDVRQGRLNDLADRVSTIKVLADALLKLPNDPEILVEIAKHQAALADAQHASAEYAAMARAFLH